MANLAVRRRLQPAGGVERNHLLEQKFTFMSNIRIHIQPPHDKGFDWPYEQVPRIGEQFFFGPGLPKFRVVSVSYNRVAPGKPESVAVVVLQQIDDTPA